MAWINRIITNVQAMQEEKLHVNTSLPPLPLNYPILHHFQPVFLHCQPLTFLSSLIRDIPMPQRGDPSQAFTRVLNDDSDSSLAFYGLRRSREEVRDPMICMLPRRRSHSSIRDPLDSFGPFTKLMTE